VQLRDVGVAFEHSGHAVIAPEDLFGLPPFAGIVQRHQIAQWLVQLESKRVKDFRHNKRARIVWAVWWTRQAFVAGKWTGNVDWTTDQNCGTICSETTR
jgi:hypothetical protein